MVIPKKEPHMWLYYPVDEDGEALDHADNSINPFAVLDEFFSCYHLKDAYYYLWEILKAALEKPDAEVILADCKPKDLIYFYEQCHDVLTAAYVIAKEKHEQKQKSV